jgi:hypothetical protein
MSGLQDSTAARGRAATTWDVLASGATLALFGAALSVVGLFLPWWDFDEYCEVGGGCISLGLPPAGIGIRAPAGPLVLVLAVAVGGIAWRALRNGGASPQRTGLIALAAGATGLIGLDWVVALIPQPTGEVVRMRFGFPQVGVLVSAAGAATMVVGAIAVRPSPRGPRAKAASVSGALLLAASAFWLLVAGSIAQWDAGYPTATLIVLAVLGIGLRAQVPLTAVRPSSVGLLLLGVGAVGVATHAKPSEVGGVLALAAVVSIVGARLLDLPIGEVAARPGWVGRARLVVACAALLAFALGRDAIDAARDVGIHGWPATFERVRVSDWLNLIVAGALTLFVVARLIALWRRVRRRAATG